MAAVPPVAQGTGASVAPASACLSVEQPANGASATAEPRPRNTIRRVTIERATWRSSHVWRGPRGVCIGHQVLIIGGVVHAADGGTGMKSLLTIAALVAVGASAGVV